MQGCCSRLASFPFPRNSRTIGQSDARQDAPEGLAIESLFRLPVDVSATSRWGGSPSSSRPEISDVSRTHFSDAFALGRGERAAHAQALKTREVPVGGDPLAA